MWHPKKNKGFTLVEIIISVTVLMIIMALSAGFMQRMTDASIRQRRIQEQQVNQERARNALLQMTRDVRDSNNANFVAGELVLNANFKNVSGSLGSPFVIRYRTEDAPLYLRDGFTIHSGSPSPQLLFRDIESPTGTLGYTGAAGDYWMHDFVPVVVQTFNANKTPGGSINLELELWVPVVGNETLTAGDIITTAGGTLSGFKRWNISSAVSYQRLPS